MTFAEFSGMGFRVCMSQPFQVEVRTHIFRKHGFAGSVFAQLLVIACITADFVIWKGKQLTDRIRDYTRRVAVQCCRKDDALFRA